VRLYEVPSAARYGDGCCKSKPTGTLLRTDSIAQVVV